MYELPSAGTISTPTRFTDNKTERYLDEITAEFRYQVEINSCETSCITNTLKDLALGHKLPALAIKLREVNRICNYRYAFGPEPQIIIPHLNKRLIPLGYSAHETNGSKYSEILKVLNDSECSFPIIGFQQEYFEQEWGITLGNSRDDHTVVLLLQNETLMGFYDPFEGQNKKMKERNQGFGRGVVVLPTPRVTAYWDSARESNWFMWIRKDKKVEKEKGKKEVQTLIDSPDIGRIS